MKRLSRVMLARLLLGVFLLSLLIMPVCVAHTARHACCASHCPMCEGTAVLSAVFRFFLALALLSGLMLLDRGLFLCGLHASQPFFCATPVQMKTRIND